MLFGANELGNQNGTVTADELIKFAGAPFLVTTSSTTPASGSCAAQFVVKDAAGVALTVPASLQVFLTTSTATLTRTAAGTGMAVLTNGLVTELDAAHKVWLVTTTAAGLLGVTLTSGAGTYYLAFVLPNGKHVFSSALVVN